MKYRISLIDISFRPVLLVKMARERRKITGDERYYAAMEKNSLKFADRVEAILARPFKILFQEPMLFVLTTYLSVRNISRSAFISSSTRFSSLSTAVFTCCSKRIQLYTHKDTILSPAHLALYIFHCQSVGSLRLSWYVCILLLAPKLTRCPSTCCS